MPSLKDIRTRITSVASTMQITSAMKLVSAAKLKKAQDSITQLRPYSEKMQELLQNISANLDGDAGGEYTQTKTQNKVLLVTVSSNKGLAGGFNSNVIKKTNQLIQEDFKDKEVKVITLGKKAFDILKKQPEFLHENNEIVDKPNSEKVNAFTQELMDEFVAGTYSEIYIIYNQFKNAAVQVVQAEKILPLEMKESNNAKPTTVDYLYEPNKEQIVLDLIPKSIKTQVFKAVLDSQASEHGARMTAMHKATDNADELRRDLVISYNKARQASITTEILEIVGGAEALAG